MVDKKKITVSARAEKYVKDVLSGKILVPKEIVLACKKWEIFKKKYKYKPNEINKRGSIIEKLPLPEGARENFHLLDYQCWILSWVWGFWHDDKKRVVYELHLIIPRKAGKSSLFGSVLLTELVLPIGDIHKPEIFICAVNDDIAGITFKKINSILANDTSSGSVFKKSFKIKSGDRVINCEKNSGFIKKISEGARSYEGVNAVGVFIDEISSLKTMKLLNALRSGFGSAANPILFTASTPAELPISALDTIRELGEKWLEDEEDTDGEVYIFYQASFEDNWEDPKVWEKCQPAYNYMESVKTLYPREYKNATRSRESKYTFQTRQLCMPLSGGVSWISIEDLLKLNKTSGDAPTGLEWRHYIGCDFSSSIDTTAICLLSENVKTLKREMRWKIFYPLGIGEQTDLQKEYSIYAKDGHVIGSPGKIVCYPRVAEEIMAWDKKYNVRGIFCDNYDAREEVQANLNDRIIKKFQVVGKSKSLVSQETELLGSWIQTNSIAFEDNPVVFKHFKNVHAEEDDFGAIILKKASKSSKHKIDCADAAVHAVKASTYSKDHKNRGTIYNPIDNTRKDGEDLGYGKVYS